MSLRGEGNDVDALAQLVAETDATLARQRGLTRASFAGVHLIIWGVAWCVGYPSLDLLPDSLGPWVVLAVLCVACLASWIPQSRLMRTGLEQRIRLGWVVVLTSSFFVMATVAPLPLEQGALLLGCLWSLGMALIGVALRDHPLTVVAMLGVLTAGLARTQPALPALTCFGLVAGLLLVTLGLWRWLNARRTLPGRTRPTNGIEG